MSGYVEGQTTAAGSTEAIEEGIDVPPGPEKLPLYTVHIYEPVGDGMWQGEIWDNVGKRVASAAARELGMVWAMLRVVLPDEGWE